MLRCTQSPTWDHEVIQAPASHPSFNIPFLQLHTLVTTLNMQCTQPLTWDDEVSKGPASCLSFNIPFLELYTLMPSPLALHPHAHPQHAAQTIPYQE